MLALTRPGRPENTITRSDRKIASSIWWVMNRTVFAGRFPDPQQLLLHQLARLRVERGERLVHQQDFRVHHQRAGEIDALLHAAGELVGIVVLEALEPDHGDEMLGALVAPRGGTPMHSRP